MDAIDGPDSVKASIKYIRWQQLYEREKPFQIFVDIPPDAADQRYNNLVFENKEETFHNIRGQERKFSLNGHGFTFRHYDFDFDDFEDRASVESIYLPKVEKFIKAEIEDVDKVFFFDWRVRAQISFSFISLQKTVLI